jgi:hypothetical protein
MVVLLDHQEEKEIQVLEDLKDQPEQKDLRALQVLLVQQEQKVQLVEPALRALLVSQVLEEIMDHKVQQAVQVQ